MPYMNGIEVVTEIRAYERKNNKQRMTVVGLTGHESAEVKQTAISSGMSFVLTKPVNSQEILTVLKNVIGGSESQ